ncbi:MAG: hypothetical protein AAGG07_00870 [Planctomycetota bacterium]
MTRQHTPASTRRSNAPARRTRAERRRRVRRGAVSVLAMMMLILFGSLVSAMAIASKGNLRASSTHLHVVRAMGAAETGLSLAERRLHEAASRFILAHSELTPSFGSDFWTGNLGAYGTVTVLGPPSGHTEGSPPGGILEALYNMHAADENTVAGIDMPELEVKAAPANADLAIYAADNWLVTAPVAISGPAGSSLDAFQITYAPLASGTEIRAIVTGYDFGYESSNLRTDYDGNLVTVEGETQSQAFITRRVMQDFTLDKSVNAAIISPSKVLIGKNVRVEGNIGARFEDVTTSAAGDPLVLRSDFHGLDAALDSKLDDFFNELTSYDVDGDNRLRVGHPIEKQGVPLTDCFPLVGDSLPCPNPSESDQTKRERSDVTGDGYFDAFDIFIRHYDTATSGPGADAYDNRIEYAVEFVDSGGTPVDPDLAFLIDSATPDRNNNGIGGFNDVDGDGLYEPGAGDTLLDVFTDASGTDIFADQVLGYMDGYLDLMDQYAKVDGSLAFVIPSSDWDGADREEAMRGPIKPDRDRSPLTFDATSAELPELDSVSFAAAAIDLQTDANGGSFWQQVADQLGVDVSDLEDYSETSPEASYDPMSFAKPSARYLRVDPDDDGDGLPDNHAESYIHFEKMPLNAPNFTDWYYRPVFEHMTFKDVQIPMGLNGLFVNCTFAGVTWVRSHTDNTHVFWNTYGKLKMDPGDPVPAPLHQREVHGDDPGEDLSDIYQPILDDMNPPGQFLLKAIDVKLDKGDVLKSEVGGFDPTGYANLPEPLIINGRRVTDSRLYSNNVRFHDCLFVGSIVSDPVNEFTHVRNKTQFTGVTRFSTVHPDAPEDLDLNPDEIDIPAILRSSMMLPNFSVDIGQFNSPADQNVQLQGAIIAGVMDVRGNADIHGALLLTFDPELGQGPLRDYLGNPLGNAANFNTTLGYFGPDDGDEESLDPEDLPIDSASGRKVAGWDTDGDGIFDVPGTDSQPAGSTPVLFEGYGRILLRYDPDMVLPDGIMLPFSIRPLRGTYQEGNI